MMIESDTTLTSLLSPEDFESANKFCKENLMVDLNMAPKLKPAFLLNNVVVMAYVKHVGKFNPQEQLDTFFQSQAAQNGKRWTVWKLPNSNSTCFSTVVHYNDKHSYSCALLII